MKRGIALTKGKPTAGCKSRQRVVNRRSADLDDHRRVIFKERQDVPVRGLSPWNAGAFLSVDRTGIAGTPRFFSRSRQLCRHSTARPFATASARRLKRWASNWNRSESLSDITVIDRVERPTEN